MFSLSASGGGDRLTTMTGQPVRDEVADLDVSDSWQVYRGMVWNIRSEQVDLGDAGVVRREFMEHTGAVAILVLNDDEEVLLLRQYRHPVRSYLWELPAGLLDVPEEPWLEAAKRELAEEADLRATRWDTLVDFYTSPGGSDEFIRVFLARDLQVIPEAERHVREAEEAAMVPVWLPLQEAVDLALAGELHNPSTVLGLLAAHSSRLTGWRTLRPVSAPFQLKASRTPR